MGERTRNGLDILPVDSAELSFKTKMALIDFIRGHDSDQPFKLPSEDHLARRLGVHAGADVRLAFTKIGNGFWAVRLK